MAGVPVIASNNGGLLEHIEDGSNGLLVTPDSIDGWAAAIERLRNDDLSLELGEGAYRRWQEDFSPQVARFGVSKRSTPRRSSSTRGRCPER